MKMANEITIYRGDTQTFNVTVVDNDGEAFDLTGYEIKMTVKTYDSDTDANAIIGPITGTVTDAEGGLATVSMDSDDTNVAPAKYVYDIQAYNSSTSAVHTIVKSTLNVVNDVTKEL